MIVYLSLLMEAICLKTLMEFSGCIEECIGIQAICSFFLSLPRMKVNEAESSTEESDRSTTPQSHRRQAHNKPPKYKSPREPPPLLPPGLPGFPLGPPPMPGFKSVRRTPLPVSLTPSIPSLVRGKRLGPPCTEKPKFPYELINLLI